MSDPGTASEEEIMRRGRKIVVAFVLISLLAMGSGRALSSVRAAVPGGAGGGAGTAGRAEAGDTGSGWALPVAIGLSVGLSCAAAGYAVGHVGSAAIGAISEKPELFGRSLVFVGLAEGIALYGLLMGILLWLTL